MGRDAFQNDEYYHIFNRGNNKRDIFLDRNDYIRFLTGMREFNRLEPVESLYTLNKLRSKAIESLYSDSIATNSLIEFVCYCLIPNHFHFLVKQKQEKGISKFMHKLSLGYTQYFNIKHNNSGSLFQGRFKSIHIKSEAQLQKVSCYVNGNAEIHKLAKAENYQWSSYHDYSGKRNGTLCNKEIILKYFKNIDEYQELTKYVIKESIEQKEETGEYSLE